MVKKVNTKAGKPTPKAAKQPPATKQESTPPATATATTPAHQPPGKTPAMVPMVLPLASITTGKVNPRTVFPDPNVLADNIKAHGLIHPPVVRAKGKGYELVAGECRLRAVAHLGWETVPVNYAAHLDGDDAAAIAFACAENSEDARTNLTALELGRACAKLQKAGWSIPKIAAGVGVGHQTVRRALALLEAPSAVQDAVAAGKLTPTAATVIAKADKKTQARLLATEGDNLADLSAEQAKAKIAAIAKADKQTAGEKIKKTPTGAQHAQGADKDAALRVWRSKREVNAQVDAMLADIHNPDMTPEEVRDAKTILTTLLYVRGEMTFPGIPDADSTDKQDQADLEALNAVIEAYAPPTPPTPAPKEKKGKPGKKGHTFEADSTAANQLN